MKLVKISEYAKLKGVSVRTLKRRIKEGLLKYEKTDSGRIMIPIESLKDEYIVTYARVSSSENKDNLISQSKRLQDYCSAKGWIVKESIEEIGSGLNDERRKLIKLFLNPNITKVVVEHKDRLTRFGFNYLKNICDFHNTEIVILSKEKQENSLEQELAEDIISIIHSFSGKLYGMRKSVKKKIDQELENEENPN